MPSRLALVYHVSSVCPRLKKKVKLLYPALLVNPQLTSRYSVQTVLILHRISAHYERLSEQLNRALNEDFLVAGVRIRR